MLGDSYVSTYVKYQDASTSLPDSIKTIVRAAYETATLSPDFDKWVYRDIIGDRLSLLAQDKYQELLLLAQNYPLKAKGHVIASDNPNHYPTCMICHQNGRE